MNTIAAELYKRYQPSSGDSSHSLFNVFPPLDGYGWGEVLGKKKQEFRQINGLTDYCFLLAPAFYILHTLSTHLYFDCWRY